MTMDPVHVFDRIAPNYIYKCFNADSVLIYVGMTLNPEERLYGHSKRTPWWNEVARVETEHHSTRYDVRRREAELIHSHRPVHNRCLSLCVTAKSRLHAHRESIAS